MRVRALQALAERPFSVIRLGVRRWIGMGFLGRVERGEEVMGRGRRRRSKERKGRRVVRAFIFGR